MALQVTDWTGFYANAGVGYGFWDADTTTVSATTGACVLCTKQRQGGDGWLGEIGLGYDYQFSSRIVGGAFFDYDFSSLRGTIQDQGPFLAGTIKQNSSWYVGARAGWLMTPEILNYFSVGYTHAHFDGAAMGGTGGVVMPAVVPGYSTSDYSGGGWFIGSGLEVAVAPGWFWRSEYRYAEYSNQTLTDTNPAAVELTSITFKPVEQTATTEIVYKFDWADRSAALIAGCMVSLGPERPPLTLGRRASWAC